MQRYQIQQLKTALAALPKSWQVVPVRGKRPLRKAWNRNLYTPKSLEAALDYLNNCTGIGLLTGTAIDEEGYIVVAIDQDGWAAAETLKKLLTPAVSLVPTKALLRQQQCLYLADNYMTSIYEGAHLKF